MVSAGSQGLRVMPCRLETPDESIPQSGMTVEPTITAPASVSRSTTGELRSGTTGTTPALPAGMGTPARARFSLTVAGTPSSGPRGSPRRQRSVLSRRGDPGRLVGAVPQGVELGLGVVHDGQSGLHHLGGGEAAVGVGGAELGAGEPGDLPRVAQLSLLSRRRTHRVTVITMRRRESHTGPRWEVRARASRSRVRDIPPPAEGPAADGRRRDVHSHWPNRHRGRVCSPSR